MYSPEPNSFFASPLSNFLTLPVPYLHSFAFAPDPVILFPFTPFTYCYFTPFYSWPPPTILFLVDFKHHSVNNSDSISGALPCNWHFGICFWHFAIGNVRKYMNYSKEMSPNDIATPWKETGSCQPCVTGSYRCNTLHHADTLSHS